MSTDLRPATEEETADYLAGHLAIPGSVETDHGLMVPKVERSSTAYDPTFDAARVDEGTVRRLIGIGVPLRGVGTIVLQGRFSPGGRGCYGSVIVMCYRPNQYRPEECYSTHRAIVRAEDGQEPYVFAEQGNYDMTRADAEADLLTR